MIKRIRYKHWYGVKLLFMETKRGKYRAFRIDTLVRENTFRAAIKKAEKLWKNTPHPHGHVPGAKWEYVRPLHAYECFTPPVEGGMLAFIKEKGRTWKDALDLLTPHSKFELSQARWPNKPSSYHLCRALFVYFIRPKRSSKRGVISNCECIVGASSESELLARAYQMAVNSKTHKMAIKVRKGLKPKSVIDFVGIHQIIPIYGKMSDGIELYRTVQNYKTKKEILALYPTLRELVGAA